MGIFSQKTPGKQSPSLNILANAASLLSNNIVDRAANFFLYLLVGRYLGTFVFGQITLALTLFVLFQILAMVGIKKVVIREVARDRTTTNQYLMNGSMIVILTAILAIVSQWVFGQIMGYSENTSLIIFLFSLGLIPYSLSAICEAVFQAWERMKYITYANAPVNIIKIGLVFLLFELDYGVTQLAIVWIIAPLAILCISWWLIIKNIHLETRH